MNLDDSIATRASLLERMKDREDQASWQQFFDTYWHLIYRVAKKAGLTDPEAQDVVQDTVISVANKVGEFRYDPTRCSFKTWMLRMTRWRIIDQLRKRMPAQPVSSAAAEDETRTAALERMPDPAGDGLGSLWDAEWEKTVWEMAVAKIKRQVNPEQFQMFDLYVVKQLPVAQVAGILGVGVARVYLAKHRVTAQIKKEIRNLENRLV